MYYQQQKSLLFLVQFPSFKSGFGTSLCNLHWLLPILSSMSMHWVSNAQIAGTEMLKQPFCKLLFDQDYSPIS